MRGIMETGLTKEQEEELLNLLGDDELSEEELTKKIESLPYAEAAERYLALLFRIGN